MIALPALIYLIAMYIKSLSKMKYISIISIFLILFQGIINFEINKDKSMIKLKKYFENLKIKDYKVFTSPFPLYNTVNKYIDKKKVCPLTYPTDKNDLKYLKNKLKKDIGDTKNIFLIWQDIGHLIGTGKPADLTARKILEDDYNLKLSKVEYTPHSPNELILLYKNEKKQNNKIKNYIYLTLKFKKTLTIEIYEYNNNKLMPEKIISKYTSNLKIKLLNNKIYCFLIYKNIFLKKIKITTFWNPSLTFLPFLLKSNKDITVNINNLPFFFSNYYIVLINLSFVILILSTMGFILKNIILLIKFLIT